MCGALPASACSVDSAAERGGHGRSDVRVVRPRCARGRDEDGRGDAAQIDLRLAEGLTKQPSRAVPLDRLADLSPRQESDSRRSDSRPIPQSEVLGSNRASRSQHVPQNVPVPDDAIPSELLTGQRSTYRVVSRFLPFARRRASTFLPPGVALRLRKPCFLLPLRTLG